MGVSIRGDLSCCRQLESEVRHEVDRHLDGERQRRYRSFLCGGLRQSPVGRRPDRGDRRSRIAPARTLSRSGPSVCMRDQRSSKMPLIFHGRRTTSSKKTDSARWVGRRMAVHEGGEPYGEGIHVIHLSRTDVNPEDDVPVLGGPTDAHVQSASWTRQFTGRKLYRILGEMWRTEWLDPASHSPIVRGDRNQMVRHLCGGNVRLSQRATACKAPHTIDGLSRRRSHG
jgi:hypothetical protein